MEITLYNAIDELFKECNLKLEVLDDPPLDAVQLPTKKDLVSIDGTPYDKCNDETKLILIETYIWNENRFKIIDWRFFLPNLNFTEQEVESFIIVFNVIKIEFWHRKIRCVFVESFKYNSHFERILNNKNFVKLFTKEFQMKAIFGPTDQLTWELRGHISDIIKKKLIEIGFIEKTTELPKLIMNHLDIQHTNELI